MSLFHLYAAYGIMPTHILRGIHVAFILFLGFLLFPVAKRFRHRVLWWDWIAAAFSLVIVGNMLFGGDAFLERAIDPTALDKVLGVALILMVLEAARRTSGWIMPAICVGSSHTRGRPVSAAAVDALRHGTSAASSAICT